MTSILRPVHTSATEVHCELPVSSIQFTSVTACERDFMKRIARKYYVDILTFNLYCSIKFRLRSVLSVRVYTVEKVETHETSRTFY